MLYNHAERLTRKGYHAISISRPDTETKWNGPTRVAEDGWIEGDSIIAYDPGDTEGQYNLTLNKGDAVYLTGTRKGQPAEIAKIDEMFEDPEKHIWMRITYFWRPERIRLKDDVDWHEYELFLNPEPEPEENPSTTIELTPVHVHEARDASAWLNLPNTFFYRRSFRERGAPEDIGGSGGRAH